MSLFAGFFRCHNCGRDVDETYPTRRFRLCASCWQEVMPGYDGTADDPGRRERQAAETPEQAAENAAYWRWYYKMELRYPLAGKHSRWRQAGALVDLPQRAIRPAPVRASYRTTYTLDGLYPFCECGQERPEYEHALPNAPRSLFGGPRAAYCPACEARYQVESYARMAGAIHPEWDHEDWLDRLYEMIPAAFELGVLPDYWFELMHSLEEDHEAE